MIMRSLTGDEINAALNSAMLATVNRMRHEGILNDDAADQFLARHICLIVTRGGFRDWLARHFTDTNEASVRVQVAEVLP